MYICEVSSEESSVMQTHPALTNTIKLICNTACDLHISECRTTFLKADKLELQF